MANLGRAVAVVAWIAALIALTTWAYSDAALALGTVATVLAGAIVGRWWFVGVPLAPAALWVVLALLTESEPDAHGATDLAWALYGAFVAVVLAALIAAGVALNRLGARLTRARRGPAPPAPR